MMGDVTCSEVLTSDGGTRVPPAVEWSVADRLLVVLGVAWVILVTGVALPLVVG